jgi:DNA-binding CsgD family transcriptional regulator
LQRELLKWRRIDCSHGHSNVAAETSDENTGSMILLEFLTKPLREQELLPKLQRSYNFLTPREREVLALVVAGRPNKQIAAQLELVTVKVHRSQISRKMRARPLVDLVRMADACWVCPTRHKLGPRRVHVDANDTVFSCLCVSVRRQFSNVKNTILSTKPAFALYSDGARHHAGVDAATPLPGSMAIGAATNPEIVDNH